MESGARNVGDILREWADSVEAGFEMPRWSQQEGLRAVAAADLMGQVRALIERSDSHPAALIVLAGAALETALRAAAEQLELRPKAPGISNLGTCLRANAIITVQEAKDLQKMGVTHADGKFLLQVGFRRGCVQGVAQHRRGGPRRGSRTGWAA